MERVIVRLGSISITRLNHFGLLMLVHEKTNLDQVGLTYVLGCDFKSCGTRQKKTRETKFLKFFIQVGVFEVVREKGESLRPLHKRLILIEFSTILHRR